MTIFSSHQINEYYRESYQSYEIVDYKTVTVVDEYAGWSRDCGCRVESFYMHKSGLRGWAYSTASTNGNHQTIWNQSSEYRCNCSQKYGPYNCGGLNTSCYVAICGTGSMSLMTGSADARSWASSRSCPKGWGKGVLFKSSYADQWVSAGQGYLKYNETHTESKPVYGYVTRYRNKYRSYISARASRA